MSTSYTILYFNLNKRKIRLNFSLQKVLPWMIKLNMNMQITDTDVDARAGVVKWETQKQNKNEPVSFKRHIYRYFGWVEDEIHVPDKFDISNAQSFCPRDPILLMYVLLIRKMCNRKKIIGIARERNGQRK